MKQMCFVLTLLTLLLAGQRSYLHLDAVARQESKLGQRQDLFRQAQDIKAERLNDGRVWSGPLFTKNRIHAAQPQQPAYQPDLAKAGAVVTPICDLSGGKIIVEHISHS